VKALSERQPWEKPTLQRLSLSLSEANPGIHNDGEANFS
jgi:hypothetical protein